MTSKNSMTIEEILFFLKLTQEELSDIIHLPNEDNGQISSEIVTRLSTVIHYAVKVLEDEAHASRWLKAERSILGGVTPLSLTTTDEGMTQVVQLLGRIEHGVFS